MTAANSRSNEAPDAAGAEAAGPRAPACLYCSGRSYAPLYEGVRDRLGVVDGRWAFLACRECGSAMLSPFPRPEQLAGFYPPVYTFGCCTDASRPAIKRLLSRLEYRLFYGRQCEVEVRRILRGVGWPGRGSTKLLDVGCGHGLHLRAFRARGLDVAGMDFQAEAVEYVTGQLGIPAVRTDFEHLPEAFPAESFDVVTGLSVLEHVCDARGVLSACRGLLKPGGWFVALVPLIDSLQARMLRSRWVVVTEAPRHVSLPSQEGVRRLFDAAGFEGVFLRPDSAVTCAGALALSLLPAGATCHTYGAGGLARWAVRLAGGLAMLLALPWCAAENYLLHRPATALVFARKP